MKFAVYETDAKYFHIIVEQKDGSYRMFGTCASRATADIMCDALNKAEQELSNKKGKK